MTGLRSETKRRNVFRMVVFYVVVSLLTLEVIDVVGEILALPGWKDKCVSLRSQEARA